MNKLSYQNLHPEDFQYLVGKSVKVIWNSKLNKLVGDGLTSYDCLDTNDQVVEEIIKLGCGEVMAKLKNQPQPVRIERLY
jgi:hypothetical protein